MAEVQGRQVRDRRQCWPRPFFFGRGAATQTGVEIQAGISTLFRLWLRQSSISAIEGVVGMGGGGMGWSFVRVRGLAGDGRGWPFGEEIEKNDFQPWEPRNDASDESFGNG